jgi:hypothetical protein
MIGVSAGASLLVAAIGGREAVLEALSGLAGPLACAVSSWVAYERAHRRAPGRLTSVMVAALAVKAVFFGAYVAVMLKVVGVDLVRFAASFTTSFIALHAMEAVFLRRLLMRDLRSPGGDGAEVSGPSDVAA